MKGKAHISSDKLTNKTCPKNHILFTNFYRETNIFQYLCL